MMRILATALTAGVLLGACQALAADEPTAPPPPSVMPRAASHTDPNEVVCKREQSTESRLGGAKVCRTRQEWADMAAAARSNVDNMQQRGNLGRGPN